MLLNERGNSSIRRVNQRCFMLFGEEQWPQTQWLLDYPSRRENRDAMEREGVMRHRQCTILS
jgi:hypothetical protein